MRRTRDNIHFFPCRIADREMQLRRVLEWQPCRDLLRDARAPVHIRVGTNRQLPGPKKPWSRDASRGFVSMREPDSPRFSSGEVCPDKGNFFDLGQMFEILDSQFPVLNSQ